MAMMRGEARLGRNRWNRLVDDGVRWYRSKVKLLEDDLGADGGRPFSQKQTDPYLVYQSLVTLRNAGSPDFWNDPAAVQRLAELSLRFGPPTLAGPLGRPGPYPGGSTQYAPRPGRTY